MQRAAEIAAQVFTARDCLARCSSEDDRVAYLLLDSAAETLMVRRIETDMAMRKWDWGSAWSCRVERSVQPDLDDMGQREREQTASGDNPVLWKLSDSQKRRIGRNFKTKLQLLAWDGSIPSSYVVVLGRLHEYRNEMYHREESRPRALRTLVQLSAWLVAELLDRLDAGWVLWSSQDPADLLQRTYARMGTQPPGNRGPLGDPSAIQKDMAKALRRDLALHTAPALLGQYAEDRIHEMHDSIAYCAGFLADEWDVSNVSEMDVVRLLYSTAPVVSKADLKGLRSPITRRIIARWDAWPIASAGSMTRWVRSDHSRR